MNSVYLSTSLYTFGCVLSGAKKGGQIAFHQSYYTFIYGTHKYRKHGRKS